MVSQPAGRIRAISAGQSSGPSSLPAWRATTATSSPLVLASAAAIAWAIRSRPSSVRNVMSPAPRGAATAEAAATSAKTTAEPAAARSSAAAREDDPARAPAAPAAAAAQKAIDDDEHDNRQYEHQRQGLRGIIVRCKG